MSLQCIWSVVRIFLWIYVGKGAAELCRVGVVSTYDQVWQPCCSCPTIGLLICPECAQRTLANCQQPDFYPINIADMNFFVWSVSDLWNVVLPGGCKVDAIAGWHYVSPPSSAVDS